MKEGQWTHSYYDEIFQSGAYFETKEQAVEDGKKEYGEDYKHFYVGQIKDVSFALTPNVDSVLEGIAQNVYDEVGEVSEDYLNHIEKEHYEALEDELNKVISVWMDKYGYKPEFFKVVNVEKVTA